MLRHLLALEESTVAGLSTLPDLDEDTCRVGLHEGHCLDDSVPAEVSAGDLYDEVFEVVALEQLDGHSTFTRTHSDWYITLGIEVTDRKGDCFPGSRRESAD